LLDSLIQETCQVSRHSTCSRRYQVIAEEAPVSRGHATVVRLSAGKDERAEVSQLKADDKPEIEGKKAVAKLRSRKKVLEKEVSLRPSQADLTGPRWKTGSRGGSFTTRVSSFLMECLGSTTSVPWGAP